MIFGFGTFISFWQILRFETFISFWQSSLLIDSFITCSTCSSYSLIALVSQVHVSNQPKSTKRTQMFFQTYMHCRSPRSPPVLSLAHSSSTPASPLIDVLLDFVSYFFHVANIQTLCCSIIFLMLQDISLPFDLFVVNLPIIASNIF